METKPTGTFKEISQYPTIQFILQHGRLGLVICAVGILTLGGILIIKSLTGEVIREYIWSALMSIPITLICMGIFSVLYEFSIRNTFMRAMQSVNAAWNTGVTVFPTHRSAPDRVEVLKKSSKKVRLMSTTLSRYFLHVGGLVEEKLEKGAKFYIIIYDPDSKALDEKAQEENAEVEDFREEIISTCRRYLGPLKIKHPDSLAVKFCKFNTPFGITIIDNVNMVLSLNIYGLSRSKNETPCLVIENKYEKDSVFKLYEESFNAIWDKLDDSIPESVKKYFQPNIGK